MPRIRCWEFTELFTDEKSVGVLLDNHHLMRSFATTQGRRMELAEALGAAYREWALEESRLSGLTLDIGP